MRIVAIHGVGNASPGEIARQLSAQAFAHEKAGFSREDLVIKDVVFPRLRGTGRVEEIIEVNWADLKVARPTLVGVLNHLIWLAVGMLHVAVRAGRTPVTRWLLGTYRAVVEGAVVWVLLEHPSQVSGPEVLQIYAFSALRILPMLGFLIGPLAVIADVLGDVLFFLSDKPLSTRQEGVDRIPLVLQYLQDTATEATEDVVLAHSQGSVFARAALSSAGPASLHLITVGCPLDSLYKRFLPWTPEAVPDSTRVKWTNAYRTGDYIGGSVEAAAPNDRSLGSGGHINYWNDPRTWTLL